MIIRKELTKEQVLNAIENHEFDIKDVNDEKVIIIMTQSWCSDWARMKSWIFDMETNEDISVYIIEYDLKEYFDLFMKFKENIWNNHYVPYLRYYKNGKFISESNYVGEDRIREIIL